MPKEWIDVADTAVKIGLGALITGAFTYFGIKLSHKSERSRHVLEHKTKLIEIAAEDIEHYFTAWDSFIGILSGIAFSRKNSNVEEDELTDYQAKAIKECDDDVIESWKKRKSAIAKLRLIKADSAAKILESCRILENEIRDRVMFDLELPTFEEIEQYHERVKKVQQNVHKELADFYETFKT